MQPPARFRPPVTTAYRSRPTRNIRMAGHETLRDLIVTGAWWDYVDELAHRAGDLLAGWPTEVRPALLTWTRSEGLVL
jgi:hypothetical protein